MREIRTSGLTRERAPNGPSLLYIFGWPRIGGQVQRLGGGKHLRLVLSMSSFSDPNCFQLHPFKDRGRVRGRL